MRREPLSAGAEAAVGCREATAQACSQEADMSGASSTAHLASSGSTAAGNGWLLLAPWREIAMAPVGKMGTQR
jgi:hypothetical protein